VISELPYSMLHCREYIIILIYTIYFY